MSNLPVCFWRRLRDIVANWGKWRFEVMKASVIDQNGEQGDFVSSASVLHQDGCHRQNSSKTTPAPYGLLPLD